MERAQEIYDRLEPQDVEAYSSFDEVLAALDRVQSLNQKMAAVLEDVAQTLGE